MHTRPIQVPRKSAAGPNPTSRRVPVRAPFPADPEPARVVRFEPIELAVQLPEECLVRVDVNGCLAGAVRALGDAPRELGVGWAFMHGFFEASDDLGHVTVRDDRVSIMVDGGEDLDRLRLEAAGWVSPRPVTPGTAIFNTADRVTIAEDGLARLVDEAYRQFHGDGGRAGFVHAAVASAGSVHCVARDLHTGIAVAKVLGWTLLDGREFDTRVLLVRGVVDQGVIRAAARCGMELVISDAMPTANAMQVASRMSMTVAGMAMSRRICLFVDGGHVMHEGGHNASNDPER
jgi:formate dehydrogenase accessory protein FdhD